MMIASQASAAAASPSVRRRSGLIMTDYGFLLGLALALLVAVDPLELDLEHQALTKHVPMLLVLPSLLLTLIGRRMFGERPRHGSSLPTLLPLLLLASIVVGGSIYARLALGIQNSFLIAGVYMWAAPAAAAMLLRCADPVRLLRAYASMLAGAGAVVFVGLALNYGVRQVYHELEYLFPALGVLVVFAARRSWQRRAGLLFFLLLAVLFRKNTGYLAGLLVVGYLLVFYVWPRWSRQDLMHRATMVHWTLIALLLLAALIAYLVINRASYLPSGNPAFRVLTYERAWLRFLDSPAWGNWFASAGSEKFTGFDTGVSDNILPTHSDVLDLLANGGVLAIALWLWGLWRVARLAYGTALRPQCRENPLAPYAHMLACMSLAGVMTYSFNPIFLQPGKALLLWTNLGFLVGISLIVKHRNGITHSQSRSKA